jgi:glycosyltransferase involved in cell wall biosynthesis
LTDGGAPWAAAEPYVSVVMPTRDSERFVGAAIESVLDQSHRALELIVVDDSTTDQTAEIVRSFGEPVRVLHGEERGPAAARNLGVAEARSDLVAFNDADDLWHRKKLARQVAHLREHPHLAGCVTQVELFWEEEVAWEREAVRGSGREGVLPGWASIALLARRDAFDRAGPLDEGRRFSDSVEWFVRAREAGLEFDLLDEVLVYHRRRPGSLSRSEENAEEFLGLLRERIQRRRENEVER